MQPDGSTLWMTSSTAASLVSHVSPGWVAYWLVLSHVRLRSEQEGREQEHAEGFCLQAGFKGKDQGEGKGER